SSEDSGEGKGDDSADLTLAIKPCVEAFFLAVDSLGSPVSKTGSASAASVFSAACRPAASRRMSASAEAEGRFTTSLLAMSRADGREDGETEGPKDGECLSNVPLAICPSVSPSLRPSVSGIGNAANGMYSSAPDATIANRLPFHSCCNRA